MINYCLLGYFRIPMWSVKTSMWSVSGLKENRHHQPLYNFGIRAVFFSMWIFSSQNTHILTTKSPNKDIIHQQKAQLP